MITESPTVDHLAGDVIIADGQHLQLDISIIQQNAVASGNIAGQRTILGGYQSGFSHNIAGGHRNRIAPMQFDASVFKCANPNFWPT